MYSALNSQSTKPIGDHIVPCKDELSSVCIRVFLTKWPYNDALQQKIIIVSLADTITL